MSISKKDIPEEFNPKDSDLAFFINNVAIEIDNHIIGRDKLEYNNLFRFRKILCDLVSNQWGLAHYVSVFKEPIENYIGKKFDNQAKIEDLTGELNKIYNDLEPMILLSKEKQESLRDFCVDLSKRTMDYREKYFSSRRYSVV